MTLAASSTFGSLQVASAATTFKVDRFYRALTRNGSVPKGALVRCANITWRLGPNGRGLYAMLHLSDRVVPHRVSRNYIGSGSWEELNEMEVLALADVAPLD